MCSKLAINLSVHTKSQVLADLVLVDFYMGISQLTSTNHYRGSELIETE